MILTVVLLHTALAAPGKLELAYQALARGELQEAESLALAAAAPPVEGEALFLAGLSRFRDGRPAEALEAIEAAGRAPIPPQAPTWHYNRAGCLYQLGRFLEAESAYLEAAALDPALASLSLVNAGFAALDADQLQRAQSHAERARAASGAALDLVADLEAEIALADPEGQAGPLPVGVDLPSRGLAGRRRGLSIWVAGGSGFDDNVLQSGGSQAVVMRATDGSRVGSALATASLGLTYRGTPVPSLVGELSYSLDQLAYSDSTAADYSLQQHLISVGLERPILGKLRAGAAAHGELTFTGLSAFRRLQHSLAASAWVAFDESAAATTRLEARFGRTTAPESEFRYLSGDRTEVSLSQELRLGRLELALHYRFRDERMGTLTQAAQLPLPPFLCPGGGCQRMDVIPFGFTGHGAGLSARAALGERLRVGVDAGLEWRGYHADSYLEVILPDGHRAEWNHRLRQDQRAFGGVVAGLRLDHGLELALRYDLLVNRSNLQGFSAERPGEGCVPPDFSCHALDYADKNYDKHLVTLELSVGW